MRARSPCVDCEHQYKPHKDRELTHCPHRSWAGSLVPPPCPLKASPLPAHERSVSENKNVRLERKKRTNWTVRRQTHGDNLPWAPPDLQMHRRPSSVCLGDLDSWCTQLLWWYDALMANLGVGVCKRHSGLLDLDALLTADCKRPLLGGGRRGRRRDTATPPQTTMRQAVVRVSEARPWLALVAGTPEDAQGQTARSRQSRWCRGWKPRALLLARPSSALAVALYHNTHSSLPAR